MNFSSLGSYTVTEEPARMINAPSQPQTHGWTVCLSMPRPSRPISLWQFDSNGRAVCDTRFWIVSFILSRLYITFCLYLANFSSNLRSSLDRTIPLQNTSSVQSTSERVSHFRSSLDGAIPLQNMNPIQPDESSKWSKLWWWLKGQKVKLC